MIHSFSNKKLQKLFESGESAGLPPELQRKLVLILAKLNTAEEIKDMNFPGSYLHKLKGELKEYWSIRLTKNWRLIFKFQDGDAYAVDLIDYH